MGITACQGQPAETGSFWQSVYSVPCALWAMAGTGLGVAHLWRDGEGGYRVQPTEGGHIDFAPLDQFLILSVPSLLIALYVFRLLPQNFIRFVHTQEQLKVV